MGTGTSTWAALAHSLQALTRWPARCMGIQVERVSLDSQAPSQHALPLSSSASAASVRPAAQAVGESKRAAHRISSGLQGAPRQLPVRWPFPARLPDSGTRGRSLRGGRTEADTPSGALPHPLPPRKKATGTVHHSQHVTGYGCFALTGRMSDVCAELDRLAALETTVH